MHLDDYNEVDTILFFATIQLEQYCLLEPI